MKALLSLFGKAAEGSRFLPLVAKSRTLLWLWVQGARGAQVTCALTLLLVATGVLPALLDKAVSVVIPETTAKEQLFGLLTSAEANPAYERCRVANRVILWSAACGAFGIGKWGLSRGAGERPGKEGLRNVFCGLPDA
jgi:hypothetical protein